ncbi:MAG: hypothetical protein HYX88_04255 [Chloroflexi bacterium]|nr:hypothetical protein [Chloroflexota bacterium]
MTCTASKPRRLGLPAVIHVAGGAVLDVGREDNPSIVPEDASLRVGIQGVLQVFSVVHAVHAAHYLIRYPGAISRRGECGIPFVVVAALAGAHRNRIDRRATKGICCGRIDMMEIELAAIGSQVAGSAFLLHHYLALNCFLPSVVYPMVHAYSP